MSKIIHFLSLLIIIIGCVVSIAAQDDTPPRFRQVMEIELRQINSIVWHPDGEIIAAAGEHDVWLYDADTLQDVAHLDLLPITVEHHLLARTPIQWSPEGQWVLIHFEDGWRVWEYENGQFTPVMTDIVIDSIEWSPDGSQYEIVNDEGTHIFAAGVHELVRTYTNVTIQWSPNSGMFAAIGDLSITIINSTNFETIRVLSGDDEEIGNYIMWSPDSRKIASLNNDRVLMWDVRSGELLFVFMQEEDDYAGREGERVNIGGIWWMPDNEMLLIEHDDLYNNRTQVFFLGSQTDETVVGIDIGRYSRIRWISPDGTKMEIYSMGNQGYQHTNIVDVNSWEWTGGYSAGEFERLPDPNNDRSLYTVSEGGNIHLLDGNTLETVDKLDGQADSMAQFVWSPDDSKFAVLTRAELQVWDVNSREMIARNAYVSRDYSDEVPVMGVIGWSTDGRYLAGNGIRIWDMQTRQLANVLYLKSRGYAPCFPNG
jgi:WD40 repeat protein